jgi:preprotein translocase subunit SecY
MTPELRRRIGFTLGALLVYRLGTFIPLPGIDSAAWDQIFRSQAGGVLGMLNVYAGGGIHRMAIFALGITPYFTAAILLQLATIVSPALRARLRQGERGREIVIAYTRYITLVLASFQAYGVAIGLEGVGNVVADPGWLFRVTTVLTLTGGTLFLAWLAEQITWRGFGNGLALILLAGFVAELPRVIADMPDLRRPGTPLSGPLVAVVAIAIVIVGFIVFMERAQRRLSVTYAERKVGDRLIAERSSHLPLKLNAAGVIPTILASWVAILASMFMAVLAIFVTFSVEEGSWASQLGQGRPLNLILHVVFIMLCAFVYTASVFDSEEAVENLRNYGGHIPGIEPGERTAAHLDDILSRTTLVGAAYLALVSVMPEILLSYAQVPFYFGGTSLLMVVCAIMDLETQVRAHGPIGQEGSRP